MRRVTFTFFALLAALTLAPTAFAVAPAQMTAGFAEKDITPEPGMEAPGGYGKSFHQEVHDPCKVRAAVFDDGSRRVALVGVDGIGIHGEMVASARSEIQKRTGIEPAAIMVAASHSHSSGPLHGIMPGQYDHASPLVQKLAYEHSICTDLKYYDLVLHQVIEAVCDADASRCKVRGGAGKGIEDTVAFNRRFRMTNGLTFTHPGQGNPDIVEPAGPTDPEVGVIGAWNEDGQLIGLRRQFRLPRHDQSGRHLGQLYLLPGKGDSRHVRQGRGRGLPARNVWRRHASGQPEPLSASGKGSLGTPGRRVCRCRGGEGLAAHAGLETWLPSISATSA